MFGRCMGVEHAANGRVLLNQLLGLLWSDVQQGYRYLSVQSLQKLGQLCGVVAVGVEQIEIRGWRSALDGALQADFKTDLLIYEVFEEQPKQFVTGKQAHAGKIAFLMGQIRVVHVQSIVIRG